MSRSVIKCFPEGERLTRYRVNFFFWQGEGGPGGGFGGGG